jgi:RNA polymerase-binding protein DksA
VAKLKSKKPEARKAPQPKAVSGKSVIPKKPNKTPVAVKNASVAKHSVAVKPVKPVEKPVAKAISKPVTKLPAIRLPATKLIASVSSNGSKKAPPTVKATVKPPEVRPPASITLPGVPTDGKPRKNLAGLTPRELEFFRDLLLAKRREIRGDMTSMESEALRTNGGSNLSNLPIHMADMGTDNYEQEFTLGLMEKDRKLLRDLNDSLAKIQNGSYGICEGTGKPISKPRLEAQPWARFSIEYARKMEGNLLR